MKKVLIITYYWPPMGGGGVQRWLKFSKYLSEFGWQPVIYTPSNADVANMDESLLSEVHSNVEVLKTEIWEPFDLYKKILGKSKEEKVQPGFLQESNSNAILQKLSVWIRGNLFIPDAKKFWIKPSIKFLKNYLKTHHIDAIISTGPPHSNHLIALGVKTATNIKWLADFRDPWTNIDYYDKLMLTSFADKKHHRLEKEVLQKADEVVTVSWSWARDFQKDTGRLPVVVTNGYDPEDFIEFDSLKGNEKFTITHIGSLNKDRNPYAFWRAISNLLKENKIDPTQLKIRLIGPTDVSVFDEIRLHGLGSCFEHIPHLPHRQVVAYTCRSNLLLLPLNDTPNIDGVIPGKLYEYVASRRPILCIGKKTGDSAKIIEECQAGSTFDFKDVEGISDFVEKQFGSKDQPYSVKASEKYSRKNLAGDIAGILDQMIN